MRGLFDDMVRRPAPVAEVVAGSTPVIAFGDPRAATVATLGINPSWREFLADDGSLLTGLKRRLATLIWLNAKDAAQLDLDQARAVVEECAAYFRPNRNPYRRWFDPLDQVLQTAFGVSYYTGTACHLDLVQWATTPVWSQLSRSAKEFLLREGLTHLRQLLTLSNIRIVLLNGRQVIEQVRASGLFDLQTCGNLAVDTRRKCWLYRRERGSVTCIGWSTNLQGNWGIGVSFRGRLGAILPNIRYRATPQGDEPQSLLNLRRIDGAGHLIKGTRAEDKRELSLVLQAWLIASDAPTIGAGRGQQPWMFINLGGVRTAVLNADTKRAAVDEYVRDVQVRGADVPWNILPNQRNGKLNKLGFRVDGKSTPGWYCYLTEPAPRRGQV
jgi:hypothetical protein